MVEDVVQTAAKMVEDVIAALLDPDGMTKPVKELTERIGDMAANLAHTLGALLGGDGIPGPTDNAMERIGDVVANLAHTLGGALGGALGVLLGGGDARDPTGTFVAPPLASYWHSGQIIDGLAEWVGDAAGNLAQAAGGALGGSASPKPTHKPFAPPVAPPVPVVPGGPFGGPAPASYSPSLGASGSPSTDAFQQLFFVVLAPFSVALGQGGKLSWHRREPLRPHSALRLAVERPG